MQDNEQTIMTPPQPEIVVTAPKPAGIKHIAGGGAAAAAIALALAVTGLKPDEGKRNVTYLDIAKLPTYCYGHMDRKAKVGTFHSDAECNALLTTDAQEKENAVIACVPQIIDNPYVLAASTRLAFNIGPAKFCNSSSARNFRAGNLRAGCNGFAAWRLVGGKVIKGLVDRRAREMAQCLQGVK